MSAIDPLCRLTSYGTPRVGVRVSARCYSDGRSRRFVNFPCHTSPTPRGAVLDLAPARGVNQIGTASVCTFCFTRRQVATLIRVRVVRAGVTTFAHRSAGLNSSLRRKRAENENLGRVT